jgi:ribosomal protein S19
LNRILIYEINSLALPKKLPPPPGTPPIRTQKRGATILPNFVGLKFAVHNGKVYQEFVVTEDMVGRKLGEFSAYVLVFPSGVLELDR